MFFVCVSLYSVAVFCVVCFFWVFFTFVAFFLQYFDNHLYRTPHPYPVAIHFGVSGHLSDNGCVF